jgi:hypothetical protein
VTELLRAGLRIWQGYAGRDTLPERALRRCHRAVRARVRNLRSRLDREQVGENYLLFWTRSRTKRRVGIYLKGACHLRMIFSGKDLMRQNLEGSCCIFNDGEVAGARSDFILQTLRDMPRDFLDEVSARLKIPADYFRPALFEKTFTVDSVLGRQEFPKSVVFFSTGSDLTRVLYRHRKHGVLVDPGGWWLTQPMERVLGDLSAVNWLRDNFENAGRIDVAAFAANFEEIISRVRANSGAHIVVFNVPTIEPGKAVHNYQFVRDPMAKRARQFNVALADLSRKLDFPIIDVDRIVKKAGIAGQKDFAHFAPELFPAVAQDVVALMKKLAVF